MVHGDGMGAPAFKHITRDLAIREAKRLAGLHPGIRFYILEAIACAEKTDVVVTDMRGDADDLIPF